MQEARPIHERACYWDSEVLASTSQSSLTRVHEQMQPDAGDVFSFEVVPESGGDQQFGQHARRHS